MLDVRLIRNDPETVRAGISRRGEDPSVIDDVHELDAELRSLAAKRDSLRAEIRVISNEVGKLFREQRKEDATELQEQSRLLGAEEKALDLRAEELEDQLRSQLLRIPNLPAADCPDGAGEDDNVVLRVEQFDPTSYAEHQRVEHWVTGEELGILDVERAVKMSGSMFVMYRGAGASLVRALCQLAIDRNADLYEEVRPPTLVRTDTMISTGHLPKFVDEAYHMERDDLWAIPTAEVPLTSIARDEILPEADLPQRFCAHTSCFRREAGSAGKDTRGLLRVHEFDKVEILSYCTPEQAPAMHDEILGRGRGAHPRPRTGVPGAGSVHRRHRQQRSSHVRHRGVRTRRGPLARGELGLVVRRLPGPAGQPALQGRGRQGHRGAAHPERLCAGGASGLGGDRRDLPPARRHRGGPRAVAAVPAWRHVIG